MLGMVAEFFSILFTLSLECNFKSHDRSCACGHKIAEKRENKNALHSFWGARAATLPLFFLLIFACRFPFPGKNSARGRQPLSESGKLIQFHLKPYPPCSAFRIIGGYLA